VRSAHSIARTFAIATIAACWLCIAPAPHVRAQTDDTVPTDSDIANAIEKLKADPNLAQERKTRTLRWAGEDKPRERSSFGRWITNFFVWLGQLSRVLIWVVGGLLAIGLAIFLYRLFRSIEIGDLKKAEAVPTHVRDLDIRPESLPDDIGAAALELWQRGEHRAALALLYRGLLSRLAHVHQVPIRDSTTEGDCLALAAKHLQAERKDYVARLIRVWQRAIYGGRDAQTEEVQALCADFASALAPTAPAGQPS
jgi:hypothetical protein